MAGVFRQARYTTPVEHDLRMMVFNRLCDPQSKLGVLRWAQTVSMPGVETSKVSHQQLLRAMDALMDHQAEVDACVAHLLRPLVDHTLSVVFYDLTTILGLFGADTVEFGGGLCRAGRPRLSIRLMAALLYLKNSFNSGFPPV